ncbi:MAG: DUF932 domain-containing protein [Vicinamibacteria bacterium]
MSMLMLHQGGWSATRADLAAVPVPDPTDSYHPVPYQRFVEEVELHVPRFGLTIERQDFALARDGAQMFGVLTCRNGVAENGFCLAIGLRNSYDRSLSVGLVAGTRVFCCDNLAFSGEITMNRKHTMHVFRDLPDLIYRMLGGVSVMKTRIAEEIGLLQARPVTTRDAHHMMVQAVREGVLPSSQLPKVIAAWERPRYEEFHSRTGWSLYNAFTEVLKSRSPRAQMENTLRLTSLFRQEIHQ